MKNTQKLLFTILLFTIIYQFSFSQNTIIEVDIPGNIPEDIYASHISYDGEKIVFVVKVNKEIPKFYECEKTKDNKWSEPVEIASVNNYMEGDRYINAPVYNYDATRIYFEADFIEAADIDIFYVERQNKSWSEPVRVALPVNSAYYDGEPSISADNNTMYFVRNNTNEKDKTCKKIYVSKKDYNGNWQEPFALLEPLNLGCERCPRILSDNKTLLFSSVRDDSKGGFDIYYAKNITKNIWIIPQALIDINTKNDDLYPSLPFNSDEIYYNQITSKEKATIFKGQLPNKFLPNNSLMLSGTITDLYTNKPIKANITVYNPKTLKILHKFYNNENTGKYQILLSPDNDYLVDFTAEGFSHTYYKYESNQVKNNEKILFDVKLFSEINLQLNIYDKLYFEPIEAYIITNDFHNRNIIDTKIKMVSKGKYILNLPIGKKYDINVNTTFFDPFYLQFDLNKVILFDEFEKDIELVSKKREITFNIVDNETQEGVSVDIKITNKSTDEEFTTKVRTDINGNVTVKVREGDIYEVTISPKGYAFYHTTFDLQSDTDLTDVKVKLKPLNKDTKFELQNITFETNSAELNSSSYEELDRVVELINNNPNIKIEISAHTDDVGSDKYNLKLSKKRAQSAINYLLDKEISIESTIAKGYGESSPIAPNDTEENKQKNRRIELKIIEIEK